jgi:hypothetical protein
VGRSVLQRLTVSKIATDPAAFFLGDGFGAVDPDQLSTTGRESDRKGTAYAPGSAGDDDLPALEKIIGKAGHMGHSAALE